jgi:hypothetical protein
MIIPKTAEIHNTRRKAPNLLNLLKLAPNKLNGLLLKYVAELIDREQYLETFVHPLTIDAC